VSDRITLRGMHFSGRHGVGSEERAEAQPFEVDIVLRLDLSRPAETDDLADTIDYSALFVLARSIVEGRSFKLIEALAAAIADAVLAAYPVDDVEVRVRKPKAPLPGAFETVEARIRRHRGGGAG
jgi:dihydroneopterin aldolase